MSPQKYTAVLSVAPATGRWRLFVALVDTTDPWPEHVFATADVPPPAARTGALAQLGFQPAEYGPWDCENAEDGLWQWTEDLNEETGKVLLLASLRVRERTEAVA